MSMIWSSRGRNRSCSPSFSWPHLVPTEAAIRRRLRRRRICDAAAEKGAQAVIPNTRSRSLKYLLDKHLYAQRHLIECCFSKPKHFRRATTRYEDGRNYPDVVTIAAIVPWLRQRST